MNHKNENKMLRMKSFIVLTLFFCCFGMVQAQNLNFFEIRGSEHLEVSTRPNLPEESSMFKDWKEGYVIFDKNKRSEFYKINYDLRENQFYILIENELFTFHQSVIDTVVFVSNNGLDDEKLYNNIENHQLQLVHQIVGGKYPIVIIHNIRISSTDINPILNNGVKDLAYKKESKYCILYNKRLIEIPKKVAKLAKERRLPADLRKIFTSYQPKKLKSQEDFISLGKAINSTQRSE